MKKILAILLILATLLLTASCVDYRDMPTCEDITYREGGLELKLTNDMKRLEREGYDFYFINIIETVIVSAFEIDAEFAEKNELKADLTAKEYVDSFIKKNDLDHDNLYYKYEPELDHHSFRYTFAEAGSEEVFYYVVVTGDVGNVWYIEMICTNEDSSRYLESFDKWKKSIKTYAE